MRPYFSVLLLALLLPQFASASTINYDLAAEWSEATNPNGPWSYEVGGSVAPGGPRGGDPWGSAQHIWGSGHVGWSKSNGSELFQHDWSAGDVFTHTTAGAGTNIRWTSSAAGVVSVLGGAWQARDIGRTNRWDLTLNGAVLTGGFLASGDPFSSTNPFSFSAGSGGASAVTDLTVNAGDVLLLELTTADGIGDYSVVDLQVAFTAVPEPSSGAFLALALLALCGRRRR